jgi:glutamate 5-kinase
MSDAPGLWGVFPSFFFPRRCMGTLPPDVINRREHLPHTRRWVIKIGSALITAEGSGIDRAAIANWVAQMAALRQQGIEVVLVSSGAVAEGMARLGWHKRPDELYKLQAAAAVGQMGLVQSYESFFQHHHLHTAQILLTHEDLSNRERYLNARSTLCTLLKLNVVPVINENDTVTTEEIRFGDNDTLGALVTNLIEADVLIILTDQQGLYDCDPRQNPAANLVSEGRAGDAALFAMAGASGGALGRGGMWTKLRAAGLAARSGAATVIVYGRLPEVLLRVAQGETIGTFLYPPHAPIAARKQWLASHLQMRGRIHLDTGAVKVLRDSGKSLLPVGVIAIDGEFRRGEMVACLAPDGQEVARGLVNYSAAEARKIMRCSSERIAELLGYVDEPELIHRDNLVLV